MDWGWITISTCLRTQAEKMVSLDDLQSLVHECGRIHRDLGAHLPGRMVQGFLYSHLAQLTEGFSEKRTAGSGQEDPLDLGPLLSVETLMNGAVLAVDGQQADLRLPGLPHHQLSRHHQRLLVGQSHVSASQDGGQRGNQTRRTGNGGHHHIRFRLGGQPGHSLLPLQHRGPRKLLPEPRRLLPIMEGDRERRVIASLFKK